MELNQTKNEGQIIKDKANSSMALQKKPTHGYSRSIDYFTPDKMQNMGNIVTRYANDAASDSFSNKLLGLDPRLSNLKSHAQIKKYSGEQVPSLQNINRET